jgi:tetratricopeptide (TPR) repeat protein
MRNHRHHLPKIAALGLAAVIFVALSPIWARLVLLNWASLSAFHTAIAGDASEDPAGWFARAEKVNMARAWLGAGRLAALQGDWSAAEADLRTYMGRVPRDQLATFFLARALIAQNRDSELVGVLNEAVPVHIIAFFAKEELDKGNFALADQLWRGVLSSGRGTETGPFGLNTGLALDAYKRRDCQSAQFWLDDALKWQQQGLQVIDQKFLALMFYNLGKCYLIIGDTPAAYLPFQQSIEFDPMAENQVYIYLAHTAYQVYHDAALARKWLEAGLKYYPGDAEIIKALSKYP